MAAGKLFKKVVYFNVLRVFLVFSFSFTPYCKGHMVICTVCEFIFAYVWCQTLTLRRTLVSPGRLAWGEALPWRKTGTEYWSNRRATTMCTARSVVVVVILWLLHRVVLQRCGPLQNCNSKRGVLCLKHAIRGLGLEHFLKHFTYLWF